MISRFPTLDAARQKRVVAGFGVADMRGDRELHRVLIEAFGGGRPADTPAVLLARVVRDALSAIRWAPWEQLAYPLREPRHEFGIELGPPFRLPRAAPGACLRVVQALGLGALERVFLDEQSLALVPLARATSISAPRRPASSVDARGASAQHHQTTETGGDRDPHT